MNDRLREVLGGIDDVDSDRKKTMTTFGGFVVGSDKKFKLVENEVSIGNMTKHFVKNKIIEWESFKDTYYVDSKLPPKHYSKFLEILNYILPLPIYTENEDEILFLMTNIYNAKPEELANALVKTINVHGIFKLSIRHLFMSYKLYLENIIEIYVGLREEYIAKHELHNNEINDFKDLLVRWNDIDIKNSIDTSSPILFFNFPPSGVEMEESIPKLHWEIKGLHQGKEGHIQQFLSDIAKTKFYYAGFCPHVAVKRMMLLLLFPTHNLLKALHEIGSELHPKKYDRLNCECNAIVKKINKLKGDVAAMVKSGDEIHIKRKQMEAKKKFTKKDSTEDKILYFEKYVQAFIELYKGLMTHLIKKEKMVSELSCNINIIAKKIQNITYAL